MKDLRDLNDLTIHDVKPKKVEGFIFLPGYAIMSGLQPRRLGEDGP